MIRRLLDLAHRRVLALEDSATSLAAIAAELRLLRQALDAGALRGFRADLDSMIRAIPADGADKAGGEGSGSPFSPPAEIQVYCQEPHVEGVRDAGVSEAGRGEGSHPRLPSHRAENKPDAPAVMAGAPFQRSADLLPGATAAGPDVTPPASGPATVFGQFGEGAMPAGDIIDLPDFLRAEVPRPTGWREVRR